MPKPDPGLKPVFSFFGGKWRSAPRYPAPTHDTLIEPFAGGAGYSLRHYRKRVILIEKDPKLHGAWQFAQLASPAEILALPDLEPGQKVSDLSSEIPQEAKWLIGMWLNGGAAAPVQSASSFMRAKQARDGGSMGSFWGAKLRERLAWQNQFIRHWDLRLGSYESAPDVEATWFIDPPYQGQGVHYAQSCRAIDFPALGAWCRSRRGQVMVCENVGADWLPFRFFENSRSNPGNAQRAGRGLKNATSAEAIWP